jgi:hypothetical protein
LRCLPHDHDAQRLRPAVHHNAVLHPHHPIADP